MVPRTFEAIYEDGVFRPLEPISLAQQQRVWLNMASHGGDWRPDELEFREKMRAKVARVERVPSLVEVRNALSKIPGSMADDFAAEREDR